MRAYTSTYETTHQNFVKAYKLINEYVTELYLMPQKMAKVAGESLENDQAEYQYAHNGSKAKTSCQAIIEFMDSLDEYTVQTLQLFNEHKRHIIATREYMRKVSSIHLQSGGVHFGECPDGFHELTPELNALMYGLSEIKAKADHIINHFEKLENKWENIQSAA